MDDNLRDAIQIRHQGGGVMVKYRTSNFSTSIERVEVERETEHSVWVGGSREGRWTSYRKYHDTWHNAHAYLRDKATLRLESCQRNVEYARKALADISAMTESNKVEPELDGRN